MSKVTEEYPGPELSIDQLKSKLTADANVKIAKENKFPTEIIDLPSKGLLYTKDHPLSTGKVEMKYMTAKEEDILTSQNLIQKGVVIDMLLRSLIISNGEGKTVNYDDLVLGDKNAIMIASRILGYGKDYPVEFSCPKCEAKTKDTVDLAILENKEVKAEASNENSFKFKLPLCKKELTFKLLTHSDEELISAEAKRMKKRSLSNMQSYELTSRLKQMIIAIDGNDERSVVNDFVENEFISRDSLAFRTYLDTVTPNVDMSVYFECNACQHEAVVDIPMTVEFFWPRV
tara:strand:+ start:2202 stop:3065 length:864 start_codon:yes stop_codon:yes gene_type:complete